MTLWACKNCGAVMAETGTLIIESPEDMSDSYISGGVCPGCGGRGCPVEEVSE